MELPLFGGFFAGKDANFVVFGRAQSTKTGADSEEVIRVVKYSKTWQRLGSASLYGENTIVPFDAGSLRRAEDGGYLYVHTSHEMYQTSDGLNHQANLTFVLDQRAMTVTDIRSSIMNSAYGYVSHSFNQFILADGCQIVTLDHGDAGPRSAYLYRSAAADANGTCLPSFYNSKRGSGVQLMTFQDAANYNSTGASLGGLIATGSHYVAAGFSVDQSRENADLDYGQRNIFVCSVSKDSFSGDAVKTWWLTSYSANAKEPVRVSTPQLAALSDGRGMILWTVGDTLYYQLLNADGSPAGQVFSGRGALSDCAPTQIGGKVQWYVTDGGAPVFYAIDPANPNAISAVEPPQGFNDVPAGEYYSAPVDWAVEQGITKGTSKNTFSPNENCSRAQIVTFLWRASGSQEPKSDRNPFTDVKPGDYFYEAVLWAVEQGITQGTSKTAFSPDMACTRAQAVTFLWRSQGEPHAGGSPGFRDVPANVYYTQPVAWAVANEVTQGTGANTFSPNNPCTRAQIVTFLYRALK